MLVAVSPAVVVETYVPSLEFFSLDASAMRLGSG